MIRLMLILLSPLVLPAQTKEKWMQYPKEEWPQIALVNKVQYKNGDQYIAPSFSYAGTGFLIDTGEDTLAATAKHVLWIAKNRKTTKVQINDELSRWIMSPKNDSTDTVVIDKLLNDDSTEILEGSASTILERDWLVFSIRKVSQNVFPLKPRYTAIRTGERVYMPSCPYHDSTCKTYEGKVSKKLGMDILIELDIKDPAGSSGSPVIDENGHLIGIISHYSNSSNPGKVVAVAISTEYLLNVLDNRPELNAPKKDYGSVILQTVLAKGAKQAIQQYKRLADDPENYYKYNLRSPNRNGLRETGEALIGMNRVEDAIKILKLNTEVNNGYFVDYNLLAKAYLLAGKRQEAIDTYRVSTTKFDDQKENEAFGQLEKLTSGK